MRHGRTEANADGILAGWTAGVGLDDTGRRQAVALAGRLADLPLAAIVTSPLQRCLETTAELIAVPGPADQRRPAPRVEDRLAECRYGDWTGRSLRDLAQDPLWQVVQAHPSAVTFPGAEGESMLAMQQRAVSAIRDHDSLVAAEFGDDAVWVAVSHGDVIKAVLADALGMHLDAFQRIVVDPCSVSVIRYTPLRPFAVKINDTGGDLNAIAPSRHQRRGEADAKGTRDVTGVADVADVQRAGDAEGGVGLAEASDAVIGGPAGPGGRKP